MLVLTVNAGSSSIRLAAFRCEASGACAELAREAGARDARDRVALLRRFLRRVDAESPDAVAHRVVHGGARLVRSRRLDVYARSEIGRLAPLAPLHNPHTLQWVQACDELLGPEVAQVGVFDTAFYADLPDRARFYALPQELAAEQGLRRFGFHGIAHQALWRRWEELHPNQRGKGRVISLQLGAGCSVTATVDGRPLDTSMGFSPLEGLVMATRCGDLDPGVVIYLVRALGLTPDQLEELLNQRSGLLGVSGVSADMRELLASREPAAHRAIDLYCYRARKYLGAYLAVMGGADAIVFGGGVGEHAPVVRAGILEGLQWAGAELDAARNSAAVGGEACISCADSAVEAWVVPVDEAAVLAQEAMTVVQAQGAVA